jgi:pSer/pThr/pTyr-binding forkhead associated (FHA) protein
MPATEYILTLRTGAQEGKVFTLDKGTVILGRDTTNDIVLPDAEVSRRHSRMSLSPQGYVLEDLGSTNGTFVNGERLSGPHLLIPGDQIGLSQKLILSFDLASESKATTLAVEPLGEEPAEEPFFKAEVEDPAEDIAWERIKDAPVEEVQEPARAKERPRGDDFEVLREAVSEKKRSTRWIIAGIGCAALVVICGVVFWYMDAYHDKILYAPIYTLMRLLGFQ